MPEAKQREVLEYAKQIGENRNAETTNNSESEKKPKKRKLLEKLDAIMSQIPKEDREGYPTDGSLNHDHYLYGAPKREYK